MDAAETHRQHIDRWFYPCSYAMHRGLADMYISDAQFMKTYEDMAPGLAQHRRRDPRERRPARELGRSAPKGMPPASSSGRRTATSCDAGFC